MFLWQRCLETEGGCTVNVRRKREEKRLLPDCPGTKKKETLFSFPTWPTRKKISRRRQRLQRKGMGKIAGHSAKKWICLVWEPAWRGWAEAWKVSQRKFSTNWNKTKKNYKKRIKLKIRRKKKKVECAGRWWSLFCN